MMNSTEWDPQQDPVASQYLCAPCGRGWTQVSWNGRQESQPQDRAGQSQDLAERWQTLWAPPPRWGTQGQPCFIPSSTQIFFQKNFLKRRERRHREGKFILKFRSCLTNVHCSTISSSEPLCAAAFRAGKNRIREKSSEKCLIKKNLCALKVLMGCSKACLWW